MSARRQIQVTVSADSKAKLDKMAKERGITIPALIAMLLYEKDALPAQLAVAAKAARPSRAKEKPSPANTPFTPGAARKHGFEFCVKRFPGKSFRYMPKDGSFCSVLFNGRAWERHGLDYATDAEYYADGTTASRGDVEAALAAGEGFWAEGVLPPSTTPPDPSDTRLSADASGATS